MFLESVGKLFFSKIRLSLFIPLLLLPILLVSFFLFSRFSHLQDLESRFLFSQEKAKLSFQRKKKKEAFLSRHEGADRYYLDHQIESLTFLESEYELLNRLLKHPALFDKQPIFERIEFLTGDKNRIVFVEESITTSNQIKETLEKQRFPVQMGEEDLKKVLSLLEDVSIDSHEKTVKSPQFLIRDFHLQKKQTPLHTDTLVVEMELLKREFNTP